MCSRHSVPHHVGVDLNFLYTMKFRIVLVSCCAILFSGCFEMNEEISVDKNGSGSFAIKTDMGQLFSMMQAFMNPADLEKSGLTEPKDTTIQLKDVIDTSSALTAEQKAVMRNGSLHLQVNNTEKLFKADMQYPFSNMNNLQQLYKMIGEGTGSMGDLMKGMGGPSAGMGGRQPSMKQVSSYFDLVTTKNSISRKLNKERYAELATDEMMQQMKQMGAMAGGLGEAKLNTIIKLPAPAKRSSGSSAELSTDKKILTLKNSMTDIFDHPEAFEFTVEF